MTEKQASILLVEDDPNLCMLLQDYLELMHFNIRVAHDGQQGYDRFLEEEPDICILDVMMPRLDGFTLATMIRKINQQVPIIFLTAKSLKEDRLKGFQQGCDDYITKPFSTEELNLRIKAILRRCARFQQAEIRNDEVFQIGLFTFDATNMTLQSETARISLTQKEANLLKLLCLNMNKLLTRDHALKTVWGDNDYFFGRSMDVFITRLRKYLKDDPNVSIQNVHGTGFKLEVKEN
jgi:two-component system OmpR family response regulator